MRLVSLSVLLLLAACGGQPGVVGDGAPVVVGPSSSEKSARKPEATQKRGGGYYKDDGPGDEIPENLDDIPDAQPRIEPLHRFANRPYVVLGKSYVPETRLRSFQQRGVASWYGKKFHGQRTSIGEPYDMFSMTAAHPTLAIPSYVRVTNVSNGKTVVVRVTDRGPFHADRIIDLSYAAAYRLGYVNVGSTRVDVEAILPGETTTLAYVQAKPAKMAAQPSESDEIEALTVRLAASEKAAQSAKPVFETAPPPSSAAGVGSGVFLQLGAFSSADNAESLRSHLSRELDWLSEGILVTPGSGLYRVQLGPYTTRADAEKVAERIRLALGYKPAFVTR